MDAQSRRNVSGTKGRRVPNKPKSPTPPQELVFTQITGPADFPRADITSLQHGRRRENRRSVVSNQRQHSATEELPESARSSSCSSIVVGGQVPATIPNSSLLEHIATSRFFHHYVSTERTFCRLDLDFTTFVIDQAAMRSALAEAVIALGILTLPEKTEASCNAARLRYSRALRFTNSQMKDALEAKSDGLLMAVILLSFFETTPDDRHTMASWTAHLNGARLLLRIRGHELLRDGPAYRMFNMLRQQILLNCLITMQPVPQDLIDLSVELMATQDEDEKAGSEIMLLFARLCNLLASARNATYLDREDMLVQAKALDDDLIGWSFNRPASYEFFTEPSSPASNAYAGYCEVYTSLFHAEVWMFYRGARLGVNGFIIQQQSLLEVENGAIFKQGVEETTHGYLQQEVDADSETSVRLAVLESLRHDVCAGTPFMLGVHASNAPQATRDIPLCKRTPVMHQLMSILNTVGITKEMSSWVTARVAELQGDTVGEAGGVFHAKSIRI